MGGLQQFHLGCTLIAYIIFHESVGITQNN